MTTAKRITVYHDTYGCDTGCCGHTVQFGDDQEFEFEHPGIVKFTPAFHIIPETDEEFVKRLVTQKYGEEHCADIDWEGCLVMEE